MANEAVRADTAETLEVRHLSAEFRADSGPVRVLEDVSFSVPRGTVVGIVGESGCGKSVTARCVMGLLPKTGRITAGEILLEGRNLVSLGNREYSALRGSELSMIFQEPMSSLNPVVRVGRQVAESLRLHASISEAAAEKRAVEMLEAVGIPDPARRARCYPHELSGGLRQRVMIAMAMICRPKLLIADEPTTALDVTVEMQILRLMRQLAAAGTGILLISHNLGVIAQICERVNVMYAGRMVEQADTLELFDHPTHPYTRGLLGAVQSLRRSGETLDTIPGTVPDMARLPDGCTFAPRCALCLDACREQIPPLREIAPGHRIRCLRAEKADEARKEEDDDE